MPGATCSLMTEMSRGGQSRTLETYSKHFLNDEQIVKHEHASHSSFLLLLLHATLNLCSLLPSITGSA